MQNILRGLLAASTACFMYSALADQRVVGSYVGILPCADCPGIEMRLDVFEDGVFYERSVYQERDARFDSIGRWTLHGDMLELRYQPDQRRLLRPDDGWLTLLDTEGRPIESKLNYTLYRSSRLSPIEPTTTLEGHFTYFADSATLEDCATGRRMPVAMEGDYLRLEKAATRSGSTLDRPLPVTVEARIVERVNMEGPARPTVIVERVTQSGSPVSCKPASAPAETTPQADHGAPARDARNPGTVEVPPSPLLAATHWRLERLGDAAVSARSGERAPFIIFTLGEASRISGSTGCNRLTGSVELAGDSMTLRGIATTRMACLEDQGIEQRFLSALESVRGWRIDANHLELRDAQGVPVARFKAVP